MKKILILAYDYPPYVSVGGLRPYSWFKYMHEFGIFPVVVTRQWNNRHGNHLDYIAQSDSAETIIEESDTGIIIRTPYIPNISNRLLLKYGESRFSIFRKSISALFEYGQFPFLIGPKVNLYFEADKYLKKNKVDVIIATGDPFILFKYASILSRKYNIPWIADYRDPWSQDKSRLRSGVPQIWDAFFEKKYMSNVSAITTVTDFFQRQISTLLPDKPFYIVPNGYNQEALEKVKGIEQSKEKLKVAVVGTIYEWHPIESFLRVSSNFVSKLSEPVKFEINFYGTNIESKIRNLIETKYQNLKPVVNMIPKIPNEQLLKKLAANNIFLLFNQYSCMGTKIYEYLALKRQIIFCYDNDQEARELKDKYYGLEEKELEDERPQRKVLSETNSGIIVMDSTHLMKVLNTLYEEFQINGFVSCSSVNVEQFSRKLQVRNLAEIIKNI